MSSPLIILILVNNLAAIPALRVNAFQSIAISNNTSLAVVAPGIAEALFATALGLLAAIPAVAAYNKFSNDLEKLSNNLEYFAIEFSSVLQRQVEEN